jgi:hypothetical protein
MDAMAAAAYLAATVNCDRKRFYNIWPLDINLNNKTVFTCLL